MGLTIFCKISFTFNVNDEILYKILSVPHKTLMDLNNVMLLPCYNKLVLKLAEKHNNFINKFIGNSTKQTWEDHPSL